MLTIRISPVQLSCIARTKITAALFATSVFGGVVQAADSIPPAVEGRPVYLNPVAIAVTPDDATAFVALQGPNQLAQVDLAKGALAGHVELPTEPTGVAVSPDGQFLAVTLGEAAGELALIPRFRKLAVRRFDAGFSPVSPVYVEDGQTLVLCNRFLDAIAFFDAHTGEKLGEALTLGREPKAVVASSDGERVFVGTHMPRQAATAAHVGLTVEIFDVASRKRTKVLDLPDGSTGLQDLALSPDGKWLFATHIVGHYELPTNQLERGWMNTNAVTVIDAEAGEIVRTVLLDDTTLGASNPWGAGVTADGQYLVVAHAGTHEISRVPLHRGLAMGEDGKELPGLLDVISDATLDAETGGYGGGHDLTIMSRVGRDRIPMPGEGPRSVAVVGNLALVAEYFSGQLTVVDVSTRDAERIVPKPIMLGNEPPMDPIRRGELRFADARLCFQGWQSCLSCHPSERTDGLNWDLLNDGIGNPKQSKSLLFSHYTPPAMITGVRDRAEVAVRAGVRFIQFAEVDERDAEAMDAYLANMRPLPSPYLVDGELSAKALDGKEVFERARCATCHDGPYFTDLKLYEVPHAEGQTVGRPLDTPTLREVWRTGPYLYDGRAVTMEEALRTKIEGRGHSLPQEQMDALVEYVMSL